MLVAKNFASNSGLLVALQELVEPSTRGDPESPLLWTCKSVRNLPSELEKQGFKISYKTVGNILHDLEYSLQANRKSSEGKKITPVGMINLNISISKPGNF